MKTIFFLLIAILAAISMLDAVGNRSRLAFSFAVAKTQKAVKSAKSRLTWNSAVNYMKAKWGALVVDGRGKLGGHVASKNRSGGYFRTKVTPVNPQTASQNTVRSRFTSQSQAWKALTQAQRDAWNAAVGSFAKTNIFGDTVQHSGFSLYCSINNNLSIVGSEPLTVPPTPAIVNDIVIGALTATDAPVLSLAYTAGSSGSVIVLFATAPQSPGRSFVKSQYRVIGTFDSDDASPFDAAAIYATKFGAITGAAGQKIFFKTLAINATTGQAGTPQSTSAIIAAAV